MRPGRFQRWLELQSVYTGTWIIPMAVEKDIPRFLNVGSFQVKVWYKGQPVKCDICCEDGHKATDCPAKGKCFNCKEAGHLAKECPRLVKHPETVVASQFPPCGQAPEGDVSGGPAEDVDLRDNELKPDSDSQTYYSKK